MPALILALNPCIDAEWRVDDVQWEEKTNILSERRWAGGKGVNVARWLKHLRGQARLLLPLGGKAGAELASCLQREKLPARIVPLREPTRVNVVVTTRAGRQMRFNPIGPKLSAAERRQILMRVERHLVQLAAGSGRARHSVSAASKTLGNGAHGVARPTVLLILSGSLPRGVPVTAYAQLIRLARRFGVKTLLDCDGPAFTAAVKARPFLVKPNQHELAQWWRKPLHSEAEIVCAARALSVQTQGWVLVSRGAKRSLLVNCAENFQCFATPPRVKPQNTLGAGDAMLAAVVRQVQLGTDPQTWLHSGVAAGSFATRCRAGKVSP